MAERGRELNRSNGLFQRESEETAKGFTGSNQRPESSEVGWGGRLQQGAQAHDGEPSNDDPLAHSNKFNRSIPLVS